MIKYDTENQGQPTEKNDKATDEEKTMLKRY